MQKREFALENFISTFTEFAWARWQTLTSAIELLHIGILSEKRLPTAATLPDHLAITNTGGNLGRNQQRKGAWDRLEGQDKQNSKQKCRITTTVAVCAARCKAIVLPRHFCLLDWWIESCPSKRSQAPLIVAVVIRTQLPARFGNGQWKWRPLEFSAASQIWLWNHQLKWSAVEVANPWEKLTNLLPLAGHALAQVRFRNADYVSRVLLCWAQTRHLIKHHK